MQKKSKSDKCQMVEVNKVLINQILGLDNPCNRDVSQLICSQEDPRLREFSEVVKHCFEFESNGYRGYSLPLGAFQDVHDSMRAYDAREVFQVAIPKDLHQLILVIRNILESSGYSATESEILRFMLWTKFPASVTPNGRFIASGSTSWCYDAAGLLQCYKSVNNKLMFGPLDSVDTNYILNAFINGDWAPNLKATSVLIQPNHRISVLTVEVLRKVDDSHEDNQTESTTLNLKEDTDNDSIK